MAAPAPAPAAVPSFFRSSEMDYISLIVQGHVAHDAIEALGDLGAVQFTDLQPELTPFQRRYTKYIRRCDDMERLIRYFEDEMVKHAISPQDFTLEEFNLWKANREQTAALESSRLSLLDFVEQNLQQRHKEYAEMAAYKQDLTRTFYDQVERMHVLNKAQEFFQFEAAAVSDATAADAVARDRPLLHDDDVEQARTANAEDKASRAASAGLQFQHIVGVVLQDDKTALERMLFRVSRGNCYVRFSDIDDPLENEKGQMVKKVVFIIFYRASSLTMKLRRICDAFAANRHDIPEFESPDRVAQMRADLLAQLNDSMKLLKEERNLTYLALRNMSQYIDKWKKAVKREKAVYHTLNLFEPYMQGMLRGQAWVLRDSMTRVNDAIAKAHAHAGAGASMPFYMDPVSAKWPTPPTHFHTNKFTEVFQGVVNTYGVPRYGEANPALFTVVTFPFLFGVMYGDMGHASLLLLFSLFMVINEKKFLRGNLGEIFRMCFQGRYMMLLMSIFAIYCGIVYNDLFAQGTNFFGSVWHFPHGNNTEASRHGYDVYPFGVDPIWHVASNDLLFFNSLKMKLSVILGVTQMTFGLFLKTSNAIFFKNKLDLIFECIPQLVFMLGLFGYMNFLIFYKWSVDWRAPSAPGAPPNLIDTLISIVLKPGTVADPMFAGQAGLQVFLLLCVFFAVPTMLLPKPLILRAQHKKRLLALEAAGAHANPVGTSVGVLGDTSDEPMVESHGGGGHGGGDHGHGDGEFEFGEVMIHQAIETIEFVLGTVSNTASYLRLWALSLAHSELATVFWVKALEGTVSSGNPVMIVVGYAVFAAVTFGVLCVMDVLECFLHALRLHWVEFQNKFYKADGYKFEPFSFKKLL